MNESTKYRERPYPECTMFYWCSAIVLVASFLGCGGVVGSAPPPPPPPPPAPSVTISVSPTSASVVLSETEAFTATVANTTNTAVNWSVNGAPGGSAASGTIDATGVYTAPAIIPATGTVTVAATSVADPTKSASASIQITSNISVSVSPQAAPVEIGSSKAFSATVSSVGSANPNITWAVSGTGCAGAACGIVDTFGNYTAPQNLPSPPGVSLIATSVADSSKSGAAAITITSSFTVSLTGPATAGTSTVVNYKAAVAPAPNSNPNRAVTFSVSGAGCSGAACGTITPTGAYTAPAVPPSPATVQITATAVADPTKTASISVTIFTTATVSVSPPAVTLAAGAMQAFQATVAGLQDTTVTWDVNGIVGGSATLGTIQNSQTNPDNTVYTAPAQIPPGGSVNVRASSNANPNLSAYAIINFTAGIGVGISPASVMRATGRRQTFLAQVNDSTNQSISWTVNGIPGGNSGVGQICVTGSNPCQPISGENSGSVDYLAPAVIPFPNPVLVTATSQADGTTSNSASVTILPHLVLNVLPGTAVVADGSRMEFSAAVLGTNNQQVIWNISGSGCTPAGACGSIDSSGLYTAPASPPAPNSLTVTATSLEDSSQTASAQVMISGGPYISMLAPSSAYAGSAGGFTLDVSGNGFVPASPGPGSTILVTGTARDTSCESSTDCTASLDAADLALAGNLSVQVESPGGSVSNSVNFVVLAPGSGAGVIPLTPGAPSAAGKDIVVVELSTNGGANTSGSASLDIAAIGAYSISTNSCVLADSPVILTRPASGASTADICVFSTSGLDPSFTYTISGPAVPDITILNREPLGLGILHLKLQISATAAPGPRTLFVENSRKDKAAGTGILEVR